MKNVLSALLLVAALSSSSYASLLGLYPYFRPLDPAHPHLSGGALVDPVTPGNTSLGTSLALITHSPADGCVLPSLVCESWSPLTVGFSANAGRALLSVGPSVNLAPLVKAGLLQALNAVTLDENYRGLKSTLSSEPLSKSDLAMAFGPNYVLSPTEKWKGYFRIFAGGAWRF